MVPEDGKRRKTTKSHAGSNPAHCSEFGWLMSSYPILRRTAQAFAGWENGRVAQLVEQRQQLIIAKWRLVRWFDPTLFLKSSDHASASESKDEAPER